MVSWVVEWLEELSECRLGERLVESSQLRMAWAKMSAHGLKSM